MSAGFSVGHDVSIVAIADGGTRLQFIATMFSWKPIYKEVAHEPLNSPPQWRELPAGHQIEITFDRTDPQAELFFSTVEAGYWAGLSTGTGSQGSIFAYINNPDGSQTTRNYQGVAMQLSDGGDASVDKAVVQKISGKAGTCVIS